MWDCRFGSRSAPAFSWKLTPPHSSTFKPRCSLYQAPSFSGSFALKKIPPMPMTRFIWNLDTVTPPQPNKDQNVRRDNHWDEKGRQQAEWKFAQWLHRLPVFQSKSQRGKRHEDDVDQTEGIPQKQNFARST